MDTFKITIEDNAVTQVNAHRAAVDGNGYLRLYAQDGGEVAVFAPGGWSSVVKVEVTE